MKGRFRLYPRHDIVTGKQQPRDRPMSEVLLSEEKKDANRVAFARKVTSYLS